MNLVWMIKNELTRNCKMLKNVAIKKSKISNSKKLISSLSNSIQCYVPRRTFNQWKILIFQEPVPVILYFLKIGPKFFITFEFFKGYGFTRNFPDFQSLDASSSVKCKIIFEEFWILPVPFVLSLNTGPMLNNHSKHWSVLL